MSRYAVPRTNPYTVPRTNPVRLRAGERMSLRDRETSEPEPSSGLDSTSLLLGAAIGAGLMYLFNKPSAQVPAQGVERLLSDVSDTQNYDQFRPALIQRERVLEVLTPINSPPFIVRGYYVNRHPRNPFQR